MSPFVVFAWKINLAYSYCYYVGDKKQFSPAGFRVRDVFLILVIWVAINVFYTSDISPTTTFILKFSRVEDIELGYLGYMGSKFMIYSLLYWLKI